MLKYFNSIENNFIGELFYAGSATQIKKLIIPDLQPVSIKLKPKNTFIFSNNKNINLLSSVGYVIKNKIITGSDKFVFYNLVPESFASCISNITYRNNNEILQGINYPSLTRFSKQLHLYFQKRMSCLLNISFKVLSLGADLIEYKNFFNNDILNSIVIETELNIGELFSGTFLSVFHFSVLKPLFQLIDFVDYSDTDAFIYFLKNFEKSLSEKYDFLNVSFNDLIENSDNVKLQLFINKVLSSGMNPYVLAELYSILNLKMREKLVLNISKLHRNDVLYQSTAITKGFSSDYSQKLKQVKLLEENVNLKLKPVLLKIIEEEGTQQIGYIVLQEVLLNREIEKLLHNNIYEDILFKIQMKGLHKKFFNELSRNILIRALLDVNKKYVIPFSSFMSENGKKMFYDDMNYIKKHSNNIDILKARLQLLQLYKSLSTEIIFYNDSTETYKKYLSAIESEKSMQFIYSKLTAKFFIVSLLDEDEKSLFNILQLLSSKSKSELSSEITILKRKVDALTILKAKEKIVQEIETLIETGKLLITIS